MPDVIPDIDAIPDQPQEMYFIKRCLRALQDRLAVLEQVKAQPKTEEELKAAIAKLDTRIGVLEREPDPASPVGLTVPMCRVYNSANISITNATPTVLTFNSEDFDVGGMHSTTSNTSRITTSVAGKYLMGATICWSPSVFTNLQVRIIKNGVVDPFVDIIDMENGSGASHMRLHPVTLFDCAAGDYFEVQVYQVTGAALNVDFHADYSPRFWATMIPALRPAA